MERPDELLFMVAGPISEKTRKAAQRAWGEVETCYFWSGSELDERIKRHTDVANEFFAFVDAPADSLTDQEAEIVMIWDPHVVSKEDYAELITALGDLVRTNGGLGIRRVRAEGLETMVGAGVVA
jgi:hypothetical protein